MLEKEGISYKIPNENEANINKRENIDDNKKKKVSINKKFKNMNKLKKRKSAKFQEDKEEQNVTSKVLDFVTVSNMNKGLTKNDIDKSLIIESCSPNTNDVNLAFGFKPSFMAIIEESNSDIDTIQRKHRSKKSKKKFTNKSRISVSRRSTKRLNPMVESVFDETFDNYVPDSRNQMISIDDRIRSIRKFVMDTDD